MATDSRVKPADQVKFKNYAKKFSSFLFVLHMLFFEALLNTLAALSCNLQGDTIDLLFASTALHASLQRFRSAGSDSEDGTNLLGFCAVQGLQMVALFQRMCISRKSSFAVFRKAFKLLLTLLRELTLIP